MNPIFCGELCFRRFAHNLKSLFHRVEEYATFGNCFEMYFRLFVAVVRSFGCLIFIFTMLDLRSLTIFMIFNELYPFWMFRTLHEDCCIILQV